MFCWVVWKPCDGHVNSGYTVLLLCFRSHYPCCSYNKQEIQRPATSLPSGNPCRATSACIGSCILQFSVTIDANNAALVINVSARGCATNWTYTKLIIIGRFLIRLDGFVGGKQFDVMLRVR